VWPAARDTPRPSARWHAIWPRRPSALNPPPCPRQNAPARPSSQPLPARSSAQRIFRSAVLRRVQRFRKQAGRSAQRARQEAKAGNCSGVSRTIRDGFPAYGQSLAVVASRTLGLEQAKK
jgi:hypothetical protein